MKASELIGKRVVRTAPTKKHGDYSYTTSPIRILKVTATHIIFNYAGDIEEAMFAKKPRLLDNRWLDNKWVDYDKLIRIKE